MNNNKHHLWQSLYEIILKKLQSEFPDYIKETKNLERYEKFDNAAIDVALDLDDL